MAPIRNDPVRLRSLAAQMRSSAKTWREQVDELGKAEKRLLKTCRDDRIDEFCDEFRKAVKAVAEMEALLTKTSASLILSAEEFERTQKI